MFPITAYLSQSQEESTSNETAKVPRFALKDRYNTPSRAQSREEDSRTDFLQDQVGRELCKNVWDVGDGDSWFGQYSNNNRRIPATNQLYIASLTG